MEVLVLSFPVAATMNYRYQSRFTEQQCFLYRRFQADSCVKSRYFESCCSHGSIRKLHAELQARTPLFGASLAQYVMRSMPKLSTTKMVNNCNVFVLAQKSRQKPRFILNESEERKPFDVKEQQLKSENIDVVDNDESDDFSVDSDHKSGYIAIIGKPNVGKSTLLNQLLGQKLAIVTEKPQTTRHRILGICSDPKYQMIFYDTPGVILKKMHKLDEMMMQNVRTATINADCLLIVADISQAPEQVSNILEDAIAANREGKPALLVLNKMDLVHAGEIDKKKEWYKKFGGLNEVLVVSAKFGSGVDDVKMRLVSNLPHGPRYFPKDIVSEHPERFFVSELVREKIFLMYRQEIPYSCQVNILQYVEREANLKDFIKLEILVEKESQKAILIGKDGQALKTLATSSRLDVEDFVGKKVFLEIMVKVKENWRKNENLLHEFGYSGSPKY
ncbi:hypothetical protein O6H91_20G056600 [Diphasiastrum complanatum]|uniref:Uncharacterized protein n=2 Tax=Diphasiastrum complanatum TaxID=34168 RepID=A0ACC2AQJ0_DIPCM|nr:hypothetical protein O6H91_20G056600 [Diphasiastrum complanatum]KAJ7519810.1 hypothetical protein O6H91_20G056600 [Diphasiastrum complanatum]